jgi:3-oxoacyl-[acyl-carrier-protein] synthase III
MPYAHITGWGMAVPESILTNDDLSKMVDTNDEWIRERTGIRERHIAREHDFPSTLGVEASIKALTVANLRPTDLDLIICTTSSPEYIFPATACLIQDQLGATKAGAFDLLAACTGFIFAVNMAAQAIKSGSIKNALVVGSETLSRFIDWKDRNTCILFGDGAGAFVLQASERPGGVFSAVMHSDGSGGDSLSLPGGGSRFPATEATVHAGATLHSDGRQGGLPFCHARDGVRHTGGARRGWIDCGPDSMDRAASSQHPDHRSGGARGLKLPMDRFIVNLDRYGNTSTASIPIAVVEAVEKGQIKNGDKIVFVGFGAGLTWGALAAEWSGPMPSKGQVRPEQYRWYARVRSFVRRAIRFIEGIIFRREL